MHPDTTSLRSFEQLADRYAEELDARFRTLNLFVQHAGEIGRTHEVFLRSVLQRFLPAKLRCGSGFIVTRDGTSRQQDIIVFDDHSLPLLLEIGDCVVVDTEAALATFEVKTNVDSIARLDEAIETVMETKRHGGFRFCALYAWAGMSLESTLECLWARYRRGADLGSNLIPDAIYVRRSISHHAE